MVNKNLETIESNKNKLQEIETGLNENEILLKSLAEEEAPQEKLQRIYENISKYRNNLQSVSLSIFEENSKIQKMNSSIHSQNLKIQKTNKEISKEMQKIGSELQINVKYMGFEEIIIIILGGVLKTFARTRSFFLFVNKKIIISKLSFSKLHIIGLTKFSI